MTTVYNRGNDPFEKLYRIFKKQVEKSGIFGDLRRKEHYDKPSIRKRRKHAQALKRRDRQRRKEEGLD